MDSSIAGTEDRPTGGGSSMAPQSLSDLRPLRKAFGPYSCFRSVPAFLEVIDTIIVPYDRICDSHFRVFAGEAQRFSECPTANLACMLASVVEGTGDGTDGRRTSMMLAQDPLTAASLALSYQPALGVVSLYTSTFGQPAVELTVQVESVGEGLTAEKIQQSLAAALEKSQAYDRIDPLLALVSGRYRLGHNPLLGGRSNKKKFTELGAQMFTLMIQRLMDIEQSQPRVPCGL